MPNERAAGGAPPPGTRKPTPAFPAVPGFEIREEVGRGGMGIVYRARQTSIGREVAVKVLPAAAAKDPAFVDKFLKEAKAAARLNHENVVTAIDAGRTGTVVWFVMEFIDGETIREKLDREGPLPVDLTLRVLRDTAKALVHARRHGLVHRDVKPDNIMLNADGRALLCDLGLARLVDPTGGDKGKRTGTAEGTPYYIAPEQARGFADVDIRADIYALGATAYHMLAGEYPYDGADAREIMWKQVNRPFPDVTEKRDDLPEALVELLERMVAKDREKRPATPEEVVEGHERIMTATGAGPAAELDGDTGTDAGTGTGTTFAPKQIAVLAGGIVLALALAIGGGMAILGGEKTPATDSVPVPVPVPEPAPKVAEAPPEKGNTNRIPTHHPVSETSREAEAALKFSVVSVSYRAEAISAAEAIRQLREIASAYAGTPAARKCEDEARALETKAAESLTRRLRDVDAIAADLAGRGEFASAAGTYAALLDREKGGPGEARVRDAIRRIEEQSSAAFARLETAARAAAAEGRLEAAEAALAAFADKAAGPSADRARLVAKELRQSLASSALARESDAAARAVRDHIRAGAYADARTAAEKALAEPRFAPVKAPLEVARRDADAAQEAANKIERSFVEEQGAERVELALLAGGAVAGRVTGYVPAAGTIAFVEVFPKDGGGKPESQATELRLSDLDAEKVRARGLPSGKPEAHLGNGLVFLYRGALAAGVAELRAAERRGLKLAPDVKSELEIAAKMLDEAVAVGVHRRGAVLVATGRALAALAPHSRLLGKGDLAGTGHARTFAKPIGELWCKARAAELLEGPVSAFFAGKVEGKGLKVRITYDFNDPGEAKDWKPAVEEEAFKSSSVKHAGTVYEFRGRVLWRGAFKGDLAFEAAVMKGGSSSIDLFVGHNANFFIYDRGRPWDGWLCGVGTRPPGLDKFNLSKNASKNANALFDCPSHMVARAKGSQSLTEFLFASRGPHVPATGGFRVAVQVRKRTLAMTLMGKLLATVPIPEADMQGGIAIQPFDDTLALDELKLAGEIDEKWLEAEALVRAEAELAGASAAK